MNDPQSYEISCVLKLNLIRISERRLEVFIGVSVGSTSSRSWISGTDPAIAKVRGRDSSVYILRFDEINDQWELIMFSTARAQRLAPRAAYLARSRQ
jgi:hypothetical protein